MISLVSSENNVQNSKFSMNATRVNEENKTLAASMNKMKSQPKIMLRMTSYIELQMKRISLTKL